MKNNVKKLSDYIDRLNWEKAPGAAECGELENLYAAVRRVKSLKPPVMPGADFPDKVVQSLARGSERAKSRKRLLKSAAAAAAVLAVALLVYFAALKDTNIVSAMERAYGRVSAYHGTLEVVFTSGAGERQVQSVLDVWADKQGRYAIGVLEGAYQGLMTVSDGEKVWQSPPGEGALMPVFSETHEFIFELGGEIEALKAAQSARVAGEETVAGRPAYVLEVTPQGGLPYKLWVDKETKIPLQKEGAMHNAIQYTTRYIEITFLEAIPDELIQVEGKNFREADIREEESPAPAGENPDEAFEPQVRVEVDMQAEQAQQIAADSGSSPWRLDPVFTAQVFVSLQISPEGITGEYPVDYEDFTIARTDGRRMKVRVSSDKTEIKAVYLERLVRQDETGIWTVVGYDISR